MPKDTSTRNPTPDAGTQCPSCGAVASGAFCASCGAAVAAACRSCGAALTQGARFCHRCGTASGSAGAAAPRSSTDPLPWAVAAIALVALIALIAGPRIGIGPRSDAGPTDANAPFVAGGTGARAPDISNLSARQMTDQLFNMVMSLHEAGLRDSARFVANTMAIPAFEFHDSLDADLRYDLGRIGEVSGDIALAKAQADTILRDSPTHLLGLVLATNAALLNGDTAAVAALRKRLLAAQVAELASNKNEYSLHRGDIDRALAEARGG